MNTGKGGEELIVLTVGAGLLPGGLRKAGSLPCIWLGRGGLLLERRLKAMLQRASHQDHSEWTPQVSPPAGHTAEGS